MCALKPVFFFSLLLLLVLTGTKDHIHARGNRVASISFNKRSDLKSWVGPVDGKAHITKSQRGKVLLIKALDANGALIQMQLPVATLKGAQVEVSYRIRGSKISSPAHPWDGVKVMLHAKSLSEEVWPQQNLPLQTFPWMKGGFSASIPPNADSVWLIVGLQAVSGRLWVDDISIDVVRPPRTIPAAPILLPSIPTLQSIPSRLRGAMISTTVTAQDLRTLASWGANSVRWQLTWDGSPQSPGDTATTAQYAVWLQQALSHLDSMLPLCRKLGLHLALDLHTPPGGRGKSGQECNIFQSALWQQAYLTTWTAMAKRYRTESAIWGYDLVNEPLEGVVPDSLLDWPALALQTARTIRAVDSTHWIVMEAAPGGTATALAVMEPLDVPGVIYSIHMYEPSIFTHQNISSASPGISYPGPIGDRVWNREAIRKYLQPVREWQQDYNARVYVGEFSAVRWAPGESARNYLQDCIAIFEEWGWDWTYHAFREWDGWSVEHSNKKGDEQPSITPNSRELLLKSYFRKNRVRN